MKVPSFTLRLFQTCGEKCDCHLPPYSCTQDLRWRMQAPSFTLHLPAILERKAAGAVFTLHLPAKIEVKDEDVELDDSSYAATMTNKYREDAGWYRQLKGLYHGTLRVSIDGDAVCRQCRLVSLVLSCLGVYAASWYHWQ